jgi:hypothetical protein
VKAVIAGSPEDARARLAPRNQDGAAEAAGSPEASRSHDHIARHRARLSPQPCCRHLGRVADGKGGNWTKRVALADDHEDADGTAVLTFWLAQDKAHVFARGTPLPWPAPCSRLRSRRSPPASS